MRRADAPIFEPASTTPRRSIASERVRRIAARGLNLLGRVVVVLNALALFGHFVRGRAIGLELLLYLPLVPLGSAAILAGAWIRGLGARKEGTSTVLLGVASVIVSMWWMIGRGPIATPGGAGSGPVVRVLHWNVLWGGLDRVDGGWASMIEEIVSRGPDVIVLSEAAPSPMRRRLLDRLGAGWNESVSNSFWPLSPYQYRLAVLSRWPTRIASRPAIRNGTACEVIIDHPARPFRVLAIDGKSDPKIPRSMMLEDVAALCERSAASAAGPIDVVAGDFNCVGRTRGFDWIRAAGEGYSAASESSTGWRATWPSWLPVYDIDHVWVRDSIAIRSCTLFMRIASDHRGQIAELALPE
jgi:endonuclease/exonuclease/phosphatase family metal-dependent hydrolase